MKIKITVPILFIILFLFSLSSCLPVVAQPKIHIIAIGLDYQNTDYAPTLEGTVDDSYEMVAALTSIYEKKGYSVDTTFLVQESYDILFNIKIFATNRLEEQIEEITQFLEQNLAKVQETSLESEFEGKIRAKVKDSDQANKLKNYLYTNYPNLEITFTSEINSSFYPSKTNIIKAFDKVNTYSKDDLTIIYYSGHGTEEGKIVTAPIVENGIYEEIEMEDFYSSFINAACPVIVIMDACYSGFVTEKGFEGISFQDGITSFMKQHEFSNIATLSACSSDSLSKITLVKTEEGEYEKHSAFTIEILNKLNWQHSSEKVTYIKVPISSIDGNGNLFVTEGVKSVKGYIKDYPTRKTVNEFFNLLMKNWNNEFQIPQINNTAFEINFIP